MPGRVLVEQYFVNPVDKKEYLEIEYYYYPGSPGTMYRRNGDPGDPPEDPELEIRKAILHKNGEKIDVYPLLEYFGVLEKIEDDLFEMTAEPDEPPEANFDYPTYDE